MAKSKPKRVVFVTGVAGFIGSNFINYAVRKYPQYLFIGIDTLTGVADKRNIEVLENKNFIFHRTDIRDRIELQKVFHQHKPTDIIHFAAETHVDFSIKNPVIFAETNVVGTTHLLYLAQKYGVNRFHHISTDEVYGALQHGEKAWTEDSPISPNNPYSASKAGAEHTVSAFRRTFGMNTVITRSANTYGPHQDKTKLIPLFLSRLLRGEKVPVYGKGEQMRDWLYVGDLVEAIDAVFHKGRAGEAYNIGGRGELPNIEVVKTLLALTGKPKSYITYVPDRLGHDFRYALNCQKIKKELGWAPRTTFKSGLKKTLAFYKASHKRSFSPSSKLKGLKPKSKTA